MSNQIKAIRHNGLDYKIGLNGRLFVHTGLSWITSSASQFDKPKIIAKLKKAGAL